MTLIKPVTSLPPLPTETTLNLKQDWWKWVLLKAWDKPQTNQKLLPGAQSYVKITPYLEGESATPSFLPSLNEIDS